MRDNARDRFAYERVRGWMGSRRSEYLGICHSLALRLRTLGLAQTVASLMDKGPEGRQVAEALAQWLLRESASRWLSEKSGKPSKVDAVNLIETALRADNRGSCFALTEAIRLAGSIKIFAKALLK